jgi:hypothetical protein
MRRSASKAKKRPVKRRARSANRSTKARRPRISKRGSAESFDVAVQWDEGDGTIDRWAVAQRERYVSILAMYRDALDVYERDHQNRYRAMKASTSVDTDDHVYTMLDHLGIIPSIFVSDVLHLVRHVWTCAMRRVPGEDPSITNFDRLLQRLDRGESREETVKEIARIKEKAEYRIRGEVVIEDDHVVPCEVLTCFNPRKRTMNSREYCDQHWGVALFTGARHKSKACHLWSILGMKGDPTSGGHLYNTVETLYLPIVHRSAQSSGTHWRVQRYCAKSVMSAQQSWSPPALTFVSTNNEGYKYITEKGNRLSVPPNSFCHVNRENNIVDAWLNATYRNPEPRWHLRRFFPRKVTPADGGRQCPGASEVVAGDHAPEV